MKVSEKIVKSQIDEKAVNMNMTVIFIVFTALATVPESLVRMQEE